MTEAAGGNARLRTAGIVVLAAGLVAAAIFVSFRSTFAGEPGAAWHANAGRVLFGAAAGACLAMAGALRSRAGSASALAEFVRAMTVVGAALGVAGAAAMGATGPVVPLVAGAAGAAFGFMGGRGAEAPKRSANLWAGLLLLVAMFGAVFVYTTTRMHDDWAGVAGRWLMGDYSAAVLASAGVMLLFAVLAGFVGWRALEASAQERTTTAPLPATVALTLDASASVAAGPLLGVAGFVPRFVERVGGGGIAASSPDSASGNTSFHTSNGAHLLMCAATGAGAVALVDLLPRLLVGGFAPPHNAAVLFAAPIFLLWNRARLRREAGPASGAVAALEWLMIAAITLVAVAAMVLTSGIVAEGY